MKGVTKALLSENHYGKGYAESIGHMNTIRYLAKLQKEIAEAVSIYPDFNFEKELENEEFKRLLSVGVTVKNAYEVIHIDEVIQNDKR